MLRSENWLEVDGGREAFSLLENLARKLDGQETGMRGKNMPHLRESISPGEGCFTAWLARNDTIQ